MNETDILLMKSVLDAVGHTGQRGLVILNVKSTQLMRVHLLLLKGLLEERGMRGIFVSVDRPHQYVIHLSRMHGINIGGLTFIDAIGRFSGDRKTEEGKTGLLAGPFNINNLPSALTDWARSVGNDLMDPSKGGFVMIDNPASLVPYNNFQKIEFLLSNLMGVFGEDRNILVPLIVDRDKSARLYEISRPLCIGEVDVVDIIAKNAEVGKAGDQGMKIELKGIGV